MSIHVFTELRLYRERAAVLEFEEKWRVAAAVLLRRPGTSYPVARWRYENTILKGENGRNGSPGRVLRLYQIYGEKIVKEVEPRAGLKKLGLTARTVA